jgi:mono/diheme cytochrome c family protein
MNTRVTVVVAVLVASMAACEKDRNNSSWSTAVSPVAGELVPGAHPSRGVGPITFVDAEALDVSRATEGEQLFKTRCSACHKIDERYIGPALTGVTRRRQPEWIMNMILKPEVMLKQDPVAVELLGTYLTPMANQNLTQREAESILVYFREHDKKLPAGVESAPAATTPAPKVKKGPPGT